MLDRYKLLRLLDEEYKGTAKILESDAYGELAELCIAHGDEVRRSISEFHVQIILIPRLGPRDCIRRASIQGKGCLYW
jgi:hypothetical protein